MTNLSLFAISQIFALCFCLVSIITIAETANIKLPEIRIRNVLSASPVPVKVQIAGNPEISLQYKDVYKWNVTRNEILNSTASFSPFTINWHAFDPRSDAGHAISYQSIRSGGLYQSFDNITYELKAEWDLTNWWCWLTF